MINFLFRHNKDYSRFNIIKKFTNDIKIDKDIYILLPFSKNQFFKHFFKRDMIINDFLFLIMILMFMIGRKLQIKIQELGGSIFKIGLILNILNIF